MRTCTRCHGIYPDEDSFCSKCGSPLSAADTGSSGPAEARPVGQQGRVAKPRRAPVLVSVLMAIVTLGGGIAAFFIVGGKGCGHVEGSLTSTGRPLGDFTFTPATCRSGQRMSFNGVGLIGNGPTEGGILVIDDVAKGKFLKVEIPGSCRPPDYEVCTEIDIVRENCTVFEVSIRQTSTTVNDIRLVDGHARIDCTFPQGGTAKADLVFENCD